MNDLSVIALVKGEPQEVNGRRVTLKKTSPHIVIAVDNEPEKQYGRLNILVLDDRQYQPSLRDGRTVELIPLPSPAPPPRKRRNLRASLN